MESLTTVYMDNQNSMSGNLGFSSMPIDQVYFGTKETVVTKIDDLRNSKSRLNETVKTPLRKSLLNVFPVQNPLTSSNGKSSSLRTSQIMSSGDDKKCYSPDSKIPTLNISRISDDVMSTAGLQLGLLNVTENSQVEYTTTDLIKEANRSILPSEILQQSSTSVITSEGNVLTKYQSFGIKTASDTGSVKNNIFVVANNSTKPIVQPNPKSQINVLNDDRLQIGSIKNNPFLKSNVIPNSKSSNSKLALDTNTAADASSNSSSTSSSLNVTSTFSPQTEKPSMLPTSMIKSNPIIKKDQVSSLATKNSFANVSNAASETNKPIIISMNDIVGENNLNEINQSSVDAASLSSNDDIPTFSSSNINEFDKIINDHEIDITNISNSLSISSVHHSNANSPRLQPIQEIDSSCIDSNTKEESSSKKNMQILPTESHTESTSTKTVKLLPTTESHTESTSTKAVKLLSSTESHTESTSTKAVKLLPSTESHTESTSTKTVKLLPSTESHTESTSTKTVKLSSSTESHTESTSAKAIKLLSTTESHTESTSAKAIKLLSTTESHTESTSTKAVKLLPSTESHTESTSTKAVKLLPSTESHTEMKDSLMSDSVTAIECLDTKTSVGTLASSINQTPKVTVPVKSTVNVPVKSTVTVPVKSSKIPTTKPTTQISTVKSNPTTITNKVNTLSDTELLLATPSSAVNTISPTTTTTATKSVPPVSLLPLKAKIPSTPSTALIIESEPTSLDTEVMIDGDNSSTVPTGSISSHTNVSSHETKIRRSSLSARFTATANVMSPSEKNNDNITTNPILVAHSSKAKPTATVTSLDNTNNNDSRTRKNSVYTSLDITNNADTRPRKNSVSAMFSSAASAVSSYSSGGSNKDSKSTRDSENMKNNVINDHSMNSMNTSTPSKNNNSMISSIISSVVTVTKSISPSNKNNINKSKDNNEQKGSNKTLNINKMTNLENSITIDPVVTTDKKPSAASKIIKSVEKSITAAVSSAASINLKSPGSMKKSSNSSENAVLSDVSNIVSNNSSSSNTNTTKSPETPVTPKNTRNRVNSILDMIGMSSSKISDFDKPDMTSTTNTTTTTTATNSIQTAVPIKPAKPVSRIASLVNKFNSNSSSKPTVTNLSSVVKTTSIPSKTSSVAPLLTRSANNSNNSMDENKNKPSVKSSITLSNTAAIISTMDASTVKNNTNTSSTVVSNTKLNSPIKVTSTTDSITKSNIPTNLNITSKLKSDMDATEITTNKPIIISTESIRNSQPTRLPILESSNLENIPVVVPPIPVTTSIPYVRTSTENSSSESINEKIATTSIIKVVALEMTVSDTLVPTTTTTTTTAAATAAAAAVVSTEVTIIKPVTFPDTTNSIRVSQIVDDIPTDVDLSGIPAAVTISVSNANGNISSTATATTTTTTTTTTTPASSPIRAPTVVIKNTALATTITTASTTTVTSTISATTKSIPVSTHVPIQQTKLVTPAIPLSVNVSSTQTSTNTTTSTVSSINTESKLSNTALTSAPSSANVPLFAQVKLKSTAAGNSTLSSVSNTNGNSVSNLVAAYSANNKNTNTTTTSNSSSINTPNRNTFTSMNNKTNTFTSNAAARSVSASTVHRKIEPTDTAVSVNVNLASQNFRSSSNIPDKTVASATSITEATSVSQSRIDSLINVRKKSLSSDNILLRKSGDSQKSKSNDVSSTFKIDSKPQSIHSVKNIVSQNVAPTKAVVGVNDLDELITKLKNKDSSVSEIIIQNSNVLTLKQDNFEQLFGALHQHKLIINIQLTNVKMKDSHCMVLMEALTTRHSLETLNLESNELSNLGVEMIADRCEHLSNLRELRIANQRMAVGAEADRALANCMSQNTSITKLSHSFVDRLVGSEANKFIQRNIDILRQNRQQLALGKPKIVIQTSPRPYPKREIPIELRQQARLQLSTAINKWNTSTNAPVISTQSTSNSYSNNSPNKNTHVGPVISTANVNNVKVSESTYSKSIPSVETKLNDSISSNISPVVTPTSPFHTSSLSSSTEYATKPVPSYPSPIASFKSISSSVSKPIISQDIHVDTVPTNESNVKNLPSNTLKVASPTKAVVGVNDLEELITKLKNKDSSVSEIIIQNSNVLTLKQDNFEQLFGALHQHKLIINIQLTNVKMKDSHCMVLMEALTTRHSLETLNLESNELSNLGVEMIADRCETLPNLRELRIANQRMAVGAEADRALANCMSQNTSITKLSHSFVDRLVGSEANKFIQRNIDILRQNRQQLALGKPKIVIQTSPRPYPKREIPIELRQQARLQLSTAISKMNTSTSAPVTTTQNNNDFPKAKIVSSNTQNYSSDIKTNTNIPFQTTTTDGSNNSTKQVSANMQTLQSIAASSMFVSHLQQQQAGKPYQPPPVILSNASDNVIDKSNFKNSQSTDRESVTAINIKSISKSYSSEGIGGGGVDATTRIGVGNTNKRVSANMLALQNMAANSLFVSQLQQQTQGGPPINIPSIIKAKSYIRSSSNIETANINNPDERQSNNNEVDESGLRLTTLNRASIVKGARKAPQTRRFTMEM